MIEGLHEAIDSVRAVYDERGIFLRRIGFGRKPALIVVDMAYGWTDPAYAIGSARLDEAVAGIQRLLPICRAKRFPVFFTTAPFREGAEPPFHARPGVQARFRPWDARACDLDSRLLPEPGEIVIYKENDSAFFGTHLASYLIESGVDTLIITGCSTSACIRATAVDARAYKFRPVIPRQCVQDRAAAAHEWNLFDLDAKHADVLDIEEVIGYLQELEND